MNTCDRASELNSYYDGEMAPGARSDFESHLAACQQCAGELARMQQLTALLQRTGVPAADGQLIERLHAQADALPLTSGIRRLAETLAAVAAGIVVVCAVALSQGGSAAGETAAAWESDAVTPPTAETTQGASEDATVAWVLNDLTGKD